MLNYTKYGIAACFKDLFLENLKEILFYSASFDESYSNVIKQRQMDLHIRYWNSKVGKSSVHYLKVHSWESHQPIMSFEILILCQLTILI